MAAVQSYGEDNRFGFDAVTQTRALTLKAVLARLVQESLAHFQSVSSPWILLARAVRLSCAAILCAYIN